MLQGILQVRDLQENMLVWYCGLGVDVKLLDSETASMDLDGYDGILVPGGFGSRGSDGIIKAASYAAEKNVPYSMNVLVRKLLH